MLAGDYIIHVFIQKAKQIKLDENDTIDPIIEVDCLDKKKYTTSKTNVGPTAEVAWSEHLFFEFHNLVIL